MRKTTVSVGLCLTWFVDIIFGCLLRTFLPVQIDRLVFWNLSVLLYDVSKFLPLIVLWQTGRRETRVI